MLLSFLMSSVGIAQQIQRRDLEPFSKIEVRGHIELNLIKSHRHFIEIESKKDLDEYVTEVRNEKLYFYHKNERNNDNQPKVVIYLEHQGISHFDLSGIVTLLSEETIAEPSLVIIGDGIIKGDITLMATNLKIDLSGISDLKVSGEAKKANLSMEGIGKINAKGLNSGEVEQNTNGFARIKVGS